jgi:serine/threonine protein kinase
MFLSTYGSVEDIIDTNMKKIGRYEIQSELGRGAMGVVYAAIDPLIGRQVAIKTIRLGALEVEAHHAELIERLHREARAAGVLSHPGIITIHDVGEEGEDSYIVMEFIDGETVEKMLASGAAQPSRVLLSILRKAADALDYAHAKGIIHRDIKPSNIMICHDGAIKIADFGVAKLTESTSMTQSGLVLGTPSYMSPEQAQGRAIDGNSDQFSLGVVAYRMLTGKLPFEGSTLTALLAKILWEEPEYESAGLTQPVRSVFEKVLAKEPQQRYATCTDFIRELEDAYVTSKAEALDAVSFMKKQKEAPTESKAISNAADSTSTAAPASEMSLSAADQEKSEPSSDAVPGPAVQEARKRSPLIAWSAGLGIVALAVITFFVIKAMQKPESGAQKTPAEITTATESNPEETPPSALPAPSSSLPSATPSLSSSPPPVAVSESKKQEEPVRSQPPEPKPDIKKSTVPAAPVVKTRTPERRRIPANPASGILTWSGDLERNAILVIAGGDATIGKLDGRLPGKPIQIEVEPKDLTIRQAPSPANNWNRIILYSGNRRHSSITIRWKLVK